MYAVAPKKAPQTLVYGIRQAKTALEQVDDALSLSESKAVPSHTDFLQVTCPADLSQTLIGGVVGKIIDNVGFDKLLEFTEQVAGEELSELKQDERMYFGMVDSSVLEEQFTIEQTQIAVQQPKTNNLAFDSVGLSSTDLTESTMCNSDPSMFVDVTETSRLVIMFNEHISEPAKRQFNQCMQHLKDLLVNCYGALRSFLGGKLSDSADKRKVEITVTALFFVAAFTCEQLLRRATRSPKLINSYRRVVQSLAATLPKMV